jgi:hypothetical protein
VNFGVKFPLKKRGDILGRRFKKRERYKVAKIFSSLRKAEATVIQEITFVVFSWV